MVPPLITTIYQSRAGWQVWIGSAITGESPHDRGMHHDLTRTKRPGDTNRHQPGTNKAGIRADGRRSAMVSARQLIEHAHAHDANPISGGAFNHPLTFKRAFDPHT